MDIVSPNVLVGALLGSAVVFLFSGLSRLLRSKWPIYCGELLSSECS